MFSPKSSLQPYYNFKFWPVTYQNINEYSKIKDIPRINDHIKHNEKLLLLDFTVLKDIEWSGERYINHKLQIIRTAKDGILICGNKSYPHLNLQKIEEPLGGVYSHLYSNYYTVPSGHMINSTLRALFDYHNPSRHSRCAKYTVRLFEDDLLDEIRDFGGRVLLHEEHAVGNVFSIVVSFWLYILLFFIVAFPVGTH